MMGTQDRSALWRQEFGRWGEDLAARYLAERGFKVLSRNWRCREGELDLVVTDFARVIFCEVKTRSGIEYGLPSETVTAEKAQRVHRAAQQWLREFGVGWSPSRYDVRIVLAEPGSRPQLRHHEAAF